jgi:exonuclease SbcD
VIKFLHSADLHLGKTFHDLSLIEDQRHFLEQLTGILRDPSYRALVIAGDVYDRSIPSPEAVRLFGSFLSTVKAHNPPLEILAIPGNHDSPARLGFGRELFAELGIHFAADPEESFEPVMVKAADESCAFFLLPFLNPGSLRTEEAGNGTNDPAAEILRSQAELAAEAARRLEKARGAVQGPAVLAAHLFAGGGLESASERIFLGGAERVDMGLFAGFDYVALGHLHRCQRAGKNGWYSGSPLAYSFDETETEKCVLSVEIPCWKEGNIEGSKPGPQITSIPVEPLHRVSRLAGSFERFYHPSPEDGELREKAGDYLEISLLDRSLTENALPLLQKQYPRLLSLRQDEARLELQAGRNIGPGDNITAGERRDTAADFEEFLTGLYGQTDEEKVTLFRELLGQLEAEESK